MSSQPAWLSAMPVTGFGSAVPPATGFVRLRHSRLSGNAHQTFLLCSKIPVMWSEGSAGWGFCCIRALPRFTATYRPSRHPLAFHRLPVIRLDLLRRFLDGTRRASHPPTLAVHRDPDPGSFEYFSELLAGELAALVGVEDLRPAVRVVFRVSTDDSLAVSWIFLR